jgi:biopolymer transport protein ExbD
MASAGQSRTEEVKKKARIEIIPLIDVIFFLLATFVLFTLSLNKIQSLPINLPIADPAPQKPNPDDVTIQVSDSGTLYWNKNVVLLSELQANLQQYMAQVAEPRVLVTGDYLANHKDTIQVLNEIRRAGFEPEQYSVETKTRNTGQ